MLNSEAQMLKTEKKHEKTNYEGKQTAYNTHKQHTTIAAIQTKCLWRSADFTLI